MSRVEDLSTDQLPPAEARALLEANRNIPAGVIDAIMQDIELAAELQAYFRSIAERAKTAEAAGWDEILPAVEAIMVKHGIDSGLPVPSFHEDHPLILAKGVALAWIQEANEMNRTVMAEELAAQKVRVRNSWEMLGDYEVCVVEDQETGKPFAIKVPSSARRIRKIEADMQLRHENPSLSVEAEFRAMASLEKRISPSQYRMYVLNGVFPEQSKRSELCYFFRKGRPTMAISFRTGVGKMIAALCFHPTGYYASSHVGVMTPTDEVIAALLMMRGDEAKFWGKSGQYAASDSRAGI